MLAFSSMAVAEIQGITGPAFGLTAKVGHIATGDGNSLLTWGYADSSTGQMQYPGPTLIVDQGDLVEITLSNDLAEPVSIVFPGQTGVVASAGSPGLVTTEVLPSGTPVTYTFTANEPGTYVYRSGTNVEIQLEMGLVGVIIIRPTGFAEGTAESHPDRRAYAGNGTRYDREFLFILSDMDRSAHEGLDGGIPIDPASYLASLWFINGRNGPDTLYPDAAPWLPAQPYGALAQAHPSERVLIRIVGGGRDLHPFHHHGNNTWQIAQDGRVLESAAGIEAGYPDFDESNPLTDEDWLPNGAMLPDQSVSNYTITAVPGNTYDAIFTWTGRDLNWDIYGDRPGHTATDCGVREAGEDPNSHCVDLTVTLPEQQAMTFGGLWSGSPFLGTLETLPPLDGGLNPNGGFSFMWHSHTERELTNDDIFPGGMMTMFIVEAPDVNLD
jgi:FtsP/CotA-like multicopper oxidase with cupredoxin domain